ncbi:MAG: hypothetical protein R3283_02985, partial [Balneolaceae bacterium]|nr:hypothetical protein [Balneolaceae bacterium]
MKNLLSVQEQLQSGTSDLKEIAAQYLERIKEKNPSVNAMVQFDEETVQSEADRISKKIKDGSAGPLAG